ncbi:flavin reductase family protein [Desulfovibrio aminophilus]|nr:flavin reductase family protein [Desulfovibrio aminophilus]MCM0756620.1 flavin reductase family protein [Desulfovibrio aminophilus]
MKKSMGAGTLAMPTPVWLVGAYDAEGKANAMTAAWGGICCSKPPCLAVSLRAATYTHGCIMARRAFTVSVPSAEQADLADAFGLVSGRDADKFAATGLTPVRGGQVDAPYVGEFPLVVECKVLFVHELGLHTQFVGEIVDVLAEESVLNEAGKAVMEKVRPVLYDPSGRVYHATGPVLGPGFSIGRKLVGK